MAVRAWGGGSSEPGHTLCCCDKFLTCPWECWPQATFRQLWWGRGSGRVLRKSSPSPPTGPTFPASLCSWARCWEETRRESAVCVSRAAQARVAAPSFPRWSGRGRAGRGPGRPDSGDAAGLTWACPVPRSHHAGAAELRHLPLRQLPPVPAGLPARPLLPVVSQERLHHQHCGVSLRGEGARRGQRVGGGDRPEVQR